MALKKKEIALLAMLLTAAFLLRVWQAEADPPQGLTFSNGPFSDPGLRSFDARNIVLHQALNPIGPEETPTYMMSPLFTGLLVPTFSFFGTGYVQMRFLSILFGVISIAFFYFLSKNLSNQRVALLSTAFFALAFPGIFFDRFAFLETFVMAFLILSLLLWQKGDNSKRPIAFRLSAIISFSLAFLFKPLAFIFIPVLVVAFLASREHSLNKPSWLQGIGLLAVLGLFLGAVYALMPRFFDMSGSSVPAKFAFSVVEVARNFALFFANRLFALTLLISFIALIAFLVAVIEFCQKRFSMSKARLLPASWLLFGAVPLALLSYQPPRYFLFLLPPICLLAADLFLRMIESKTFRAKLFSGKLRSLIFVAWLALFSFSCSIWLNKFFLDTADMAAKLFNVAASGFVFFIAGIAIAAILSARKRPLEISAKTKSAIFALVLFAFIASTLVPFVYWAQSPQYTLVNASRQLALDIPQGSVVMGFPTTWLCLESELTCVVMYHDFNDKQPLETFKPTHLLVTKGMDDRVLERNYGNWQGLVELVKTYKVGEDKVILYRVK